MTVRRPTITGLLWSGLAAAFAAGYLVPYKAAVADVGPTGLVLPMLLAAAVINTVLDAVLQWRNRARGQEAHLGWRWNGPTLGATVALGVASALGNEAVCRALVSLNPGLVSVTLRTQVIFVALGGLLLLRERVGLRFWLGALLAIGGFALLQRTVGEAGGVAAVGVLWALVAAAGFGSMQIAVRAAVDRIDPLQVNTLRLWLAVGLLALLPGRLAVLTHLDGRIWGLAATAALCGPVLSRLCLMRSLRTLPAAHSTLALFLAPVFAYGLAGAVFGVWPGGLEILGSLVILVAVALPVTELARDQPLHHSP